MDLLLVALLVLVGLPILSFGLIIVFALTTKFDVVGVTLRDTGLRGLLATALAKFAVKDLGHFAIPLEVSIQKKGLLPLRVEVQDIELDMYFEDVFITHVSEERSFTIAGRSKGRFRVPITLTLDLRGRVAELMRLADAVRKNRYQLAVRLEGNISLRHWFFTRTLPVSQTHHTLLGEAKPKLSMLVWDRFEVEPGQEAALTVLLRNDYRHAKLKGPLVVEFYRDVRGRDPLHRTAVEQVDLPANEESRVVIRTEAPGDEETRALYPVVYWRDERLFPKFFRRECPRVWLAGKGPAKRLQPEAVKPIDDVEAPSAKTDVLDLEREAAAEGPLPEKPSA